MRVRVTIEMDIDSEKWVAAAIDEDWYVPGEIDPEEHDDVMFAATGYFDAKDNLPRWDRDAVTVVSQLHEIVE